MSSTLLETRNPTKEEGIRGASVVFVRKDERGVTHTILACRCYESWEQWGAPTEILSDNIPDVQAWRDELSRRFNQKILRCRGI